MTIQPPTTAGIRWLAKIVLVLYGIVTALVALTLLFPTLGIHLAEAVLFLPPQAIFAGTALLVALLISVLMDMTALAGSVERR